MRYPSLILFLIALLSESVFAYDAVLTDDVSLALSGPSEKKYGSSPILLVDGKHATLLRFDLATFRNDLANSSARATLTLFVNRVSRPGSIKLCRISGEWQESFPPVVTLTPISEQTGVVSKDAGKGFIRFDVSELVTAWIDGTIANDGVAITSDVANPGVALALDSKENQATGHQAVLSIDTTTPSSFLQANKGAWQGAANYEAGDIVTYSGSTWVATTASVNSRPTAANTDWTVLAAKGDAGPVGPSGSMTSVGLRHASAKLLGILTSIPTGRMNLLTWGDSVATLQWDQLQFALARTYGGCGLGMSKLVISLSGGATNVVNDFTRWVTGNYYRIQSGETVTWSGTGPGMDTLDVYFLKEPGSGAFKIQSNDGSGWVDEITVDAAASTLTGAYTTVSKAEGNYQLRVVGVTGSVSIIGGAILRNSNGIAFFSIAYPGISLTSMNQTPVSVLTPILRRINPDVLSFEMKDSKESFVTDLPIAQARWEAAIANCDYVLCASNPVDPARQNDADQRAQNDLLQAHASAHGCIFFDGYNVFGSYAPIAANDWSDDGVHLNPSGAYYSAQHLARYLALWDTGILSASAGAIDRVNINGSPIGQSTPAAGAFTSLSSSTPLGQLSGGTGRSSLPKFCAQLSSSLLVPTGTPTVLNFGLVKTGSTGFSGSRWMPGTIGDFNVLFYLSADLSNWSVKLKRNGLDLVQLTTATTSKDTATYSALVETTAATDYFEIEVRQDSGANLIVHERSYFGGFIVP